MGLHSSCPRSNKRTVPANRLNWLTAARHILAYQALKKEITLKVQLRICEDFEEFWRHRFYLALSDQVMSNAHYWASQGKHGANIGTTSALIIVDFSGWPDGKVDSTDTVDPELLKNRNGLKGNAGRGLKDYFQILHKQAVDRESRREAKAAQIDQN